MLVVENLIDSIEFEGNLDILRVILILYKKKYFFCDMGHKI